jgi:5-methyltetrahydropteroyltriglutamate--homocysteine methyltransferase
VRIGELDDSLGPRVDRRVHRVAEAGHLLSGRVHLSRDLERLAAEVLLEQPSALLRGAEDHGAAAEDPGRDGPLQRIRIRSKRHPRGEVRWHQPVLGDRHEQQVEEEVLLLGRLLAGEEQVKVLREREPAHEVAGQVAPAHLDAIRVGLADAGLHARIFLPMPPLATTVIGSYPQPDWLIDREKLAGRLPPRVPAHELWRVDEPWLVEAQDDATRLAVLDMEEAGIDVVTDGEIRRESYSNYFANALEGLDLDEPGTALDRTGHPNPVPRVVGEIRRARPVQVRDTAFLRALTSRPIRVTVPGPFTMSQQAQNDHYPDLRSLALAYADAVNEELRDLVAAGADVVQIDEPYLQARPDDAREYALEAIERAFDGVGGTKALHTCFGYAAIVHEKPNGYPFLAELDSCPADEISIEAAQPRLDPSLLEQLPSKRVILGVLDLNDMEIEAAETVADRIRAALEHIDPERLMVGPDCGMKYLPREVARGKLQSLVEGAALVRTEL